MWRHNIVNKWFAIYYPTPILTHLDPKSPCAATTFYPYFGRGGIGIFGSRKSGSKCGESSPVDIRLAFSKEGIQYPQLLGTGAKSDCGTTAFRLKMSTSDCKFWPPSISVQKNRKRIFRWRVRIPYCNEIARKNHCDASAFLPLFFYIATFSQTIDTHFQCDII